MPYAYILECSDRSYYVGSTWDLDRRIWEHNNCNERGAKYTRRRRPVKVVWCQEFERIEDAYECEKHVQGWSRAKREALIEGRFGDLPALSKRRRRRG